MIYVLDYQLVFYCFSIQKQSEKKEVITRPRKVNIQLYHLALQTQAACLVTTICNSPTKTSETPTAANLKTKTGNHAAKMSAPPTKVS